MGKSSKSSSRTSANSGRAMSSNNGRGKPMVPKAGITRQRSRYGNGGKVK